MVFGASTIGIMTLSIKGLCATCGINDTRHNMTAIMPNVVKPSVIMLNVVAPFFSKMLSKPSIILKGKSKTFFGKN